MPSITFVGTSDDSPRLAEAEAAGLLAESVPGPLAGEAQRAAWNRLAKAPPNLVWVAWAGLTPPDLPSLRRFRVSAPSARIIIEVPAELSPPDEMVAQAVACGVVDIVRGDSTRPLAAVLSQSATFADVAAWQGAIRRFDEEPEIREKIVEKQVIVERETIVERRIATSSRPTILALWAAAPGTGATTLAIAVGTFLSGIAPTAVLDHDMPRADDSTPLPGNTGLDALTALMEPTAWPRLTIGLNALQGSQWIAPDWKSYEKSREHAYIVVDAGLADTASALWVQADRNWVLIPPSAGRWQGLWPWLNAEDQRRGQYEAIIWGPDLARWIVTAAPESACVGIPWPDQPEHQAGLIAALAPILPDDIVHPRPKRPSWLRRFAKGGTAHAPIQRS